ncbi:MAG: hypothetical protein AAF985_07175 [Bacteroidota bacterium]
MFQYNQVLRAVLLSLLLVGIISKGFGENDSLSINSWILQGMEEMRLLTNSYYSNSSKLIDAVDSIDQLLQPKYLSTERVQNQFLLHLYQRIQLREQAQLLEQDYELKLLKLRYRKAIELIKLLYEKTLSLDHHFSSMQAHQQILKLSNPQSYPDFKQIQGMVKERVQKKHRFRLPSLLESNAYLSATFSLISTLLPGSENKHKQKNFEKIACILDFTVRMNADLNIIYFETEFLRDANVRLKEECEILFKDCAKVIGYKHALISCREQDDWEMVYELLDRYVEQLLDQLENSNKTTRVAQKKEVNLRFTIDRVVDYINQYLNFINQSREYYSKFNKIIFSYENIQICIEQLPQEYLLLKKDISTTIEKFNHSYYMPELKGSRLKALLYGEPEG